MRDKGGLQRMIDLLCYPLNEDTLEQLLKMPLNALGDGKPEPICMLDILFKVRDANVRRLRQCAGLSQSTAEKARLRFQKPLSKRGKVDPEDLEEFMYDLFRISKKNVGEQEKIKKVIAANLKNCGGQLALIDCFWCVRHYGDARGDLQWTRENEAARENNLMDILDDVRDSFEKYDHRKLGEILADDIFNVLDELMEISSKQYQLLEDRLAVLVDGPKDGIDFATFLHLLGQLVTEDQRLKKELKQQCGRNAIRRMSSACLASIPPS